MADGTASLTITHPDRVVYPEDGAPRARSQPIARLWARATGPREIGFRLHDQDGAEARRPLG